MLNSYPKIYHVGHRAIIDLFRDPVIIEEKTDGSQFSFGFVDGQLQFRSHHCKVNPASAGMFQPIVNYVKSIEPLLTAGWIYRGEFLSKPKHNVLEYSRIPKNFFILFDIDKGIENFVNYNTKKFEAERLGFETAPMICDVSQTVSLANFDNLLQTESILGGVSVEGIVIKNYHRFGIDGHCLMGKYVSEKFKEQMKQGPKTNNKGTIETIVAQYKTEAHWNKAIQHLREQGLLTDEPKDIGILLKEINRDLIEECEFEIKEQMFNYFLKEIKRGIAKGFPEYYKRLLAKKQLNNEQ